MTRTTSTVIGMAVVVLALAGGGPLCAQRASAGDEGGAAAATPQGSGGWGRGGAYGRMYDPKTVETIKGKVTNVERISPMGRMSAGIHLTVQTDSGPIAVHLGPAWYLDNQDVHINRGDQIEVTGSRVEFEGKPAIIAAEVRKGDEDLTLRDRNGMPMWSGWRRRPSSGPAQPTSPQMMGQGMGPMMRPGMTGRGMMGRGMMRGGTMGRGMGGSSTQGGMMGGSTGPMPSAQLAPDDPGSLLANRAKLNLTMEQVRKLEAIQAEARADANAVLTRKQKQQMEESD